MLGRSVFNRIYAFVAEGQQFKISWEEKPYYLFILIAEVYSYRIIPL